MAQVLTRRRLRLLVYQESANSIGEQTSSKAGAFIVPAGTEGSAGHSLILCGKWNKPKEHRF